MARDGTGTYVAPQAAVVTNTPISSVSYNSSVSDIGTALTQSIARDGQTTPTANLPMGTFRHTNVGNGSARNDYAALGQLQDGAGIWGSTAGGTANALTIALSPAVTAYAAGQRFSLLPASANTAAATLAVNGLTATAIVRGNGAPLQAGVLRTGRVVNVFFDGTSFRIDEPCTGWMEISRLAPSATTAVDILLQNTYYTRYRFTVSEIVVVSGGNSILLQTSINSGASFFSGAADYVYGLLYNQGASALAAVGLTASSIPIMPSISPANVNNTQIDFQVGGASTLTRAKIDGAHVENSATSAQIVKYLAYRAASGTTDAVRFLSSGNFAGSIIVEGMSV